MPSCSPKDSGSNSAPWSIDEVAEVRRRDDRHGIPERGEGRPERDERLDVTARAHPEQDDPGHAAHRPGAVTRGARAPAARPPRAYSRMHSIRCSCGRVPKEYFSWKREMPSARAVSAILVATVSGDPRVDGAVGTELEPRLRRPTSGPGTAQRPRRFMKGTKSSRKLLDGLLVRRRDVARESNAAGQLPACPSR